MARLSTRSLDNIEHRMKGIDEGSIRYRILQSAKNFKTSWIELAQALYSVWKDRLYKDWGYMTFDAYTAKEIGIKKPTAMKLLKSYYFLEKEEPNFLHGSLAKSGDPAAVPTYESINVLRLARNKKLLDENDYEKFKKDILESGKEASQARKDLVSLMKQREELEPAEARRKKKVAAIKRLITVLKTLRTDLETQRMLPAAIIKEVSNLINKVEAELAQ